MDKCVRGGGPSHTRRPLCAQCDDIVQQDGTRAVFRPADVCDEQRSVPEREQRRVVWPRFRSVRGREMRFERHDVS